MMKKHVVAVSLGLFLAISQTVNAKQIYLGTLLEEMLDRTRIAEFPDPAFVCRQASSYNRHSKTPGTPDWFTGGDFDQFYGCEQVQGRKEWIMLETEGPGVVTRWWQTQYRAAGRIRVYLDGAVAPIFTGTGDELVGGSTIAGLPWAANRGGGRNLYLPIPFRKHCKITFESPNPDADFTSSSPRFTDHSLFYIINYLRYQPGTDVVTLTRSDLQAQAPLIAQVGQELLSPQRHDLAAKRTVEGGRTSLLPGQSLTRKIEGPGAIGQLRLRVNAMNIPQALRSTVIEAQFDGKRTVWAPVGEFFGSGLGINPFRTWWREVAEDGWMTCWWPMPFRESAELIMTNLGTSRSIEVELDDIAIADWQWTDRTMTFHTAWRGENLKAFVGGDLAKMEVWNYITVDGKGVYVGDSLSLYNRPRIHWTDGHWIGSWWGEGDEQIWVDGESFPSHFGTGSEDYFGYAFNHTHPFTAPFHAQPIAQGNWGIGHTTNVRDRVHDRIPFERRLKFDMELFHWQPQRKVDYATTTHWYAFDGATDNGLTSSHPVRQTVAQIAELGQTAAELPTEGTLDSFLGAPQMDMQQVFSGDRFPTVAVATDGTVLAFWNGVKVRRSQDGGTTWGDEIKVGPGFMGGGVTVDENTGAILAFVEAHHPPAEISVYRSTNHGKTWSKQNTVIHPDQDGHMPSMHMNEHGITLRHGPHRGRLLRPSRWYAGKNESARWPQHYTNALYSDDGGRTWHSSEPFGANGTGEAALAELSDGRIYYNSRRHWAPEGQNPRRRWTALSNDGGQTWTDPTLCNVLPDGDQDRNYGLMGGLVRLPVQGRDILIFSNIESPGGRHHGTVWASFDGGGTWPVKRLVYKGPFAYSSLNAGRPGTTGEGWIYLLFEGGPKGGGTMARFNLSWLLQGEKTGDGDLPSWISDGHASMDSPGTHRQPPRGWNSYTGYSIAVTEAELLKNIDYLNENLLPYGYDTVTVDNGWFLSGQGEGSTMALDAYGRPESHPHFFPNGLKYTIDYAHKKGIKFGIWLLRGINRRAVQENLPVEGTPYRMQDIVNKKSYCPWAIAPWWNYGVDMTKPGAQAYYDGLIQKYADMGVDFIKFDDIVPNPDEVEAVAKAIDRCGRDIVLSLSPGDHIKVEHSNAYRQANMVRITSDIWDNRGALETTFRRWEAMQDYTGPEVGSFLDMDMVCFGRLYVTRNDGWECKFTQDQKQTFMVQRALAASPLMLGGVLYRMDDFSLSLFTHPDILACNENAVIGKLVHRDGKIDVWNTPQRGDEGAAGWIGIFNRDGKSQATVQVRMDELGLQTDRPYVLRDIWTGRPLPAGTRHTFEIPADGVAFLRYKRARSGEPAVPLASVPTVQQEGDIWVDGSPEEGPLDLGDIVYETGIGIRAGSELTYDVSQRSGRFEAWVGIDPVVSVRRSGRFRVIADEMMVFDSGTFNQTDKRGSTQNPTRPIRVVVPLAGVNTLQLTFHCEDGGDAAGLCGGWGDAQFVPASAPEYEIGAYAGTTLAQTPPMGWNSWCRYGTDISEDLIKKVADAMVESGMRDAGYVYVNLDDGWQAPSAKFDDDGYPLWDEKKFPSGMKDLGDYLHERGFRYGIYSRAGWVKGHEKQFAERFADWGVDLVKYDFSNKEQQKATLDAIRAAGRDVVFSVCEWGRERPWLWAPGFNAEMWRTTYDVKDKWTSRYDNNGGIGVLRSAHQNEALGPFVGPGRWNDLDMLQVGVDGFDYGHDRKKVGFDITLDEERFQMSLWAILASPLLAANDVTAMSDQTKSILLNREVIAVNQDPLGVPGWRVKKLDQIEVWKRPLQNGDLAVVFANLDEQPRDMDVTWAQLNIQGSWEVTNLWEHSRLGRQDRQLVFSEVPSHGVVFVRLSK